MQGKSNRKPIEKEAICVARPVQILSMPQKRNVQTQMNSGHQIPRAK